MSILKELKHFAKDLSILVVEDDKELNEELVELVDIFFKKTDFAYDGAEALEKYRKFQYDLVLSDITMPKMNGVKLSQELININKFQSIVILSAHSEVSYMIDLIDIGIHQFVAKPFEQQELLYRLLKVCENKIHKQELKRFINGTKSVKEKTISTDEIKTTQTKQIKKEVEQKDLNASIEHEQVAATKFMEELKIDTLAWISIEPQIEELLEVNEDFEELIEKIYLNDITTEIINSISVILRKIYSIFTYIDELSNISDVIFELASFLDSINVDELSDEKKQKLKILEFIYDDLSRFIQTVFVYQDTLDIHYLEDSLRSSVEQLKMNISNEEIEEEELELF